MTLIDRVKKRVKVNDLTGCWIWQGWTDNGYPMMSFNGKVQRVTRLMCPDISENTLACHKCDNPSCVNPDHLFAGTHQENMDDMHRKGRHRFPRMAGELNGQAVLTRVDVEQMHLMSFAGANSRQIAKLFPVSDRSVRRILRGERWTDVYSSMVPRGSEGMI